MPNNVSQNYSSCYAKVFVGGKEIDSHRARNIVSIQVNETISGSDTCTINIKDTDGVYIDDDIFVEDVPITVELSDSSSGVLHQFNGFIAAIDVDFSDLIEFTITCMDNTYLLNREKKSNTWDNTSSFDIVSSILSGYGITLEPPTFGNFAVQESSSQSEQTDLDFIESLLSNEEVPCYFKIKDLNSAIYDKINFQKEAFISLNYKISPYEIVDLNLKIDRERLLESSTTADIETSDNRIVLARSTIFETTPITNGIKAIVSSTPVNTGYTAIKDKSTEFTNSMVLTENQRKMMNAELMTITGELNVLVTPDTNNVYVEDVINLYGIGKYLSGSFLVTDISRTLDYGGYSLSYSVSKTGFGSATITDGTETKGVTPDGTPITDNGVSSLSIADMSILNNDYDAVKNWATKYYSDYYSSMNKDQLKYYGNGNTTEESLKLAIQNATDNYLSKALKSANSNFGGTFEALGGDFRPTTTMLGGKSIPSSYSIGYVFTVPGMTLYSLASRLNTNTGMNDNNSSLNIDGVEHIYIANQFGLMKSIIYSNIEMFSKIIGFDIKTTGFNQDGKLKYLYDDYKYAPTDLKDIIKINNFIYSKYSRTLIFPSGTKISLAFFDYEQVMSKYKVDNIIGGVYGYLTYGDNYNKQWEDLYGDLNV